MPRTPIEIAKDVGEKLRTQQTELAQTVGDVAGLRKDVEGRLDGLDDAVSDVSSGLDRLAGIHTRSVDFFSTKNTELENDIATNTRDIATNANDIATNTNNIANNATRIATNENNIATHAAAWEAMDTAMAVDHDFYAAQCKNGIYSYRGDDALTAINGTSCTRNDRCTFLDDKKKHLCITTPDTGWVCNAKNGPDGPWKKFADTVIATNGNRLEC